MKRLMLWLLTAAFVTSGAVMARVSDDDGDEVRKPKKEKVHREVKKEKKHKPEKAKTHKEKKHKAKKETPKKEKSIKKHKPKKHKQEKNKTVKHDKKRQKRENAKSERAFKRTKAGKQHAEDERRSKRRQERRHGEEKSEHKRLSREAKKMRKDEREQAEKAHRDRDHAKMMEQDKAMRQEHRHKVGFERHERDEMMEKWKALRAVEVERDSAAGKYSYLYRQPAWPIHAQFVGNKHNLNVEAGYQYAVDSYNSTGGGSKSNITKLAFGENPITVQEVLLAAKLVDKRLAVGAAGGTSELGDGNSGQRVFGKPFIFIGRDESYKLDIELSRYILARDLAVGVGLPLLYRRHHLKAITPLGVVDPANLNADTREDSMVPTLLRKILLAKGMTEMGGSAAGLGDVAFFVNGQMESAWFDKLVIGLRCQVPTGKKATQTKLWAPELGNGGFTEFSVFSGVQMSYQKYFNPHVLATVAFNLQAHVDRRVPRRVTRAQETAGAAAPLRTVVEINGELANLMTFGDRISRAQAGGAAVAANGDVAVAFSEFDTTIKGFADTISTVKMTKGAEIKLRVGNVIEELFCRQGFLDIFYDFRGKMKDRISGINTDLFNVDILRQHTQELEHRVGFDYSFQHDVDTRLRFGMRYTFAGMNVAKMFEAVGSLSHSF